MRLGLTCAAIVALMAVVGPSLGLSPLRAQGKPEDQLAGMIKASLGKDFVADWQGIERLPGITWAALPPTMLQNCLPDGGCFTRQGAALIGGRRLAVIATGARTIVSNIYLRNATMPFGEPAVVTALKAAALSTELARCPADGSTGGTNWYRLRSAGTTPASLSIQTSCNGQACEGFVLSYGENLPQLQPNQLRLYSETCSATGSARAAISTLLPHERLAQVIVGLLPPASGPALYDWKALTSLPTTIQLSAGGAKKTDLSSKGDPNPMSQSGVLSFPGREFSLLFSGSATEVKTAYLEELGSHPRGEDLLGLLRRERFTIQLVRCGPVYTESINNWYRITRAETRPAMLQQSIGLEGQRVHESYTLRLDNSLPARDARDRDPGVNGCR